MSMFASRHCIVRQDMNPEARLGRYFTGEDPILNFCPVVVDTVGGADQDGQDGNGRSILKRAIGAQAPVLTRSGIVKWEAVDEAWKGVDPVLARAGDIDMIPPETPVQLLHGRDLRLAYVNLDEVARGGPGASRTYPARLMVAGADTLRPGGGEFLTPAGDGTNEVQTLTRTSTGGTFTLTFTDEDGVEETTDDIPATAAGFTAAAVQAALRALGNISAEGVTVTGSAGGPLTVTWGGEHEFTDVSQLVVDNTDATGGTVSITTTTGGVPGDPDATGYWAKTTDASLAWLVTTKVDDAIGLVEVQCLF